MDSFPVHSPDLNKLCDLVLHLYFFLNGAHLEEQHYIFAFSCYIQLQVTQLETSLSTANEI